MWHSFRPRASRNRCHSISLCVLAQSFVQLFDAVRLRDAYFCEHLANFGMCARERVGEGVLDVIAREHKRAAQTQYALRYAWLAITNRCELSNVG